MSVALDHGPECSCTRCQGFEPGNAIAATHGSYATLALKPRAAELASAIRAACGDAWDERHAAAVEAAALAGARVERALGHLLELDEETVERDYARLDDRARGWLKLYLGTLESLGLVPDRAQVAVNLHAHQYSQPDDRAPAGLADVIKLALELGAGDVLGDFGRASVGTIGSKPTDVRELEAGGES